jgi:hypothetical protein
MHQRFMDEFGISEDVDSVYAIGIHLAPIEISNEEAK